MHYEKAQLKKLLETVYISYNKKEYIHPDPLEFLDNYPEPGEREIAALIAASLAYGRVDQILKTVDLVFKIMQSSGHPSHLPPSSLYDYLMQRSDKDIFEDFKQFKYRFTRGDHLCSLLLGIKYMVAESGSLKNFFLNAIAPEDKTVIPAMTRFIQTIISGKDTGNLVADPAKGSACKRNNLFLRWLIRKDAVDPGGWDEIPSAMLIIPLDTHMHHAGKMLGFTKRKQADMKTAFEITEGFREISPDDPAKYDFCLTRFGIHPEMNFNDLEAIIRQMK